MISINKGQVLRLRNFRHYGIGPKPPQLAFTADKGKVFVVMLLGVEDLNEGGVELDCEEALNELGWVKEGESR